MLVADLAQLLQITFRRQQHAGGTGDRLDDDRGDVGRVVQRDQALEFVGEVRAVLGLSARVGVARQVVGVAQVIDRRQQLPLKVLRLPAMPPTEMPPKPTP